MILPWIKHFSKVNAISGWITTKNVLYVKLTWSTDLVVHDRSAAISKTKCLACHVISLQVSFFFLSQSFFIDKEENHLFKNIVSFELYLFIFIVYIAVYFACSRKKRSSLKYEIICKSVSLFKKMWKCNLNFHNKHRIQGKLRLLSA